ncbi:MAG: hypothetical protein CML95_06560 [Rhodobiaceae bacterium]|nr:hypothetical protein [Rhodobiaceae bacterium]|tara:strand:+ start:577 stop:1725 length:1149 start_codon:yes stop_codon:yes gene_type:complete
MSSSQIDDEIDLIELIEILFRGKWLIGGVTGIISVIAAVVLTIMPTTHSMTLSIRSLSPQDMSGYAPLNNVAGISPPIYADDNLIGQTGVILAEDLMRAVRSDIEAKASLSAALLELDPFFRDFEGTSTEKAQALTKATNAFTFQRRENTSDFLVTETQNILLTRSILIRFVEIARASIRRQNLIAIANLSKSIEASLTYEIEALEAEIDNDKQTYFDNLGRKITILKEQAKIARALNLVTPSQNLSINATASSGAGNFQPANESSFTLGYKALEEEARLLEQRKKSDWKIFSPGYAEKAAQLRKLKNDKRLQRVETGLALSPLSRPETFTPAIFDTENILVEPVSNKPLIIIVVALLSGLLASIFVLFRHYAAQRNFISAA